MVTIDKSGEETFALTETAIAIPPPPEIYTQVRENLLAYRKKVMLELVGGRVNDLIFAGHDTLLKYKAQLASLNASAYLFKNLRRHVMAMQFKDKNLDEGLYRSVESEFISPVTMYPLSAPYAVPQRLLPQVDVFQFTPQTDIAIAENVGLAQVKSFVLLQTTTAIFKDSPDMENALYDFFFFYPQVKFRGRWLFVSPTKPNYSAWNGEYVLFVRELRTANSYIGYLYYVLVWVDNDVEVSGTPPSRTGEPIFSWITTYRRENDVIITPSLAPVIEITIAGRRVKSDDGNLYGTGSTDVGVMGYMIKATGFSVDTVEATWYNSWTISLSVNNPAWGTIDPPSGDYTKRALDGFWVTAKGIDPHVFDHWELDGLNIGNTNPYYVYPLKDQTLKAVFV